MDYKTQNDIERNYLMQDTSTMETLLKRVRTALFSGKRISIGDLDLTPFISYDPKISFIYISLFQSKTPSIRFGTKKESLLEALCVIIENLRKNKNFKNFEISNEEKCRILFEVVTDVKPIDKTKLNLNKFDDNRFEPGVTGYIVVDNKNTPFYYMPTDSVVHSYMGLYGSLGHVLRKTSIGNITSDPYKCVEIFTKFSDWKLYSIKSHSFVTFKGTCVPLYRGGIYYNEFDYNILLSQFKTSVDWLIGNMEDDGRFLYYYDCAKDNRIDHEHPKRGEDNLYYNDLRHSGGVISLLRAYQNFGEEKYLNAAKRALAFSISILKERNLNNEVAYYTYYNQKSKLGGDGLTIVSLMHYRKITADKSYDKYIKGLVRQVISRLTDEGEFLGYYIHPGFQNGKPLISMSDEERKQTFSFYYPGEALLGLALFANYFNEDEKLRDYVVQKTRIAMDWIIDERPKYYKELFTILPSDAWLMQAIEEWANYPDFIKQNHIDFVFSDAETMMDKMYKKDDSPYIDYFGGYYYNYGDHFYPDGARSEGLIAAYYLAKKLNYEKLAAKILNACKCAANSQFQLFNSEFTNYAHKNPEKSLHSIRFKATRQWVRVDSIQHVACFFIRLFWAQNKPTKEN